MAAYFMCRYDVCPEPVAATCEECGRGFCRDHGSPGGDRETAGVGAVAYPAACWACGGFNADE